MSSEPGTVVRIDPATRRRRRRRIKVGANPLATAWIGGELWVPSIDDDSVSIVDPATNTVRDDAQGGLRPGLGACRPEAASGSRDSEDGDVWRLSALRAHISPQRPHAAADKRAVSASPVQPRVAGELRQLAARRRRPLGLRRRETGARRGLHPGSQRGGHARALPRLGARAGASRSCASWWSTTPRPTARSRSPARRRPRIRASSSTAARATSAASRTGTAASTLAGDADYVKLLMAGDVLLPGFLAEAVAMMDAFPSTVLAARVAQLPAARRARRLPAALRLRPASSRARRRGTSRSSRATSPPARAAQLWRHTRIGGLTFDETLPVGGRLRLLAAPAAARRLRLPAAQALPLRPRRAALPLRGRRARRSSPTSARSCAGTARPTRCRACDALHARLGGGPELDAILGETVAALTPAAARHARRLAAAAARRRLGGRAARLPRRDPRPRRT